MKIKISDIITDALITNGVVRQEDGELYKYGIKYGLLMVINVLTFILIGYFLGMLWHSIIFMMSYIPFRTYAGGYHASTELRCYVLSWNGYVCLLMSLLAAIIVIWLAPVEALNKPLREPERTIYRKKSRILLFILLCAAILLWFEGSRQYSVSIIAASDVVAVMLVIGSIKNGRVRLESEDD